MSLLKICSDYLLRLTQFETRLKQEEPKNKFGKILS